MQYCECEQSKATYNGEWDSYWCENCGLWIEEKCSDRNCEFCNDRPETPFTKSK